MLDFRRITLFCLEKRFSKHKMTMFSKIWRGHGPFGRPGYAYGGYPGPMIEGSNRYIVPGPEIE